MLDPLPVDLCIMSFCRDLAPSQLGRFTFGAEEWLDGAGKKESLEFVSKKLDDVLLGNVVTPSDPPEIDLVYSHLLEVSLCICNCFCCSKDRLDSNLSDPHIPFGIAADVPS